MKKFALVLTLLFSVVAVALCQDDTIKDALIQLGISPALAMVISVGIIFVIGNFAIPNKWAAPFLWIEKGLYLLYMLFHKVNEATNVESKKQKAARLAKKVAMVIMLVGMGSIAMAQEPGTFFGPLDEAVKVTTDRAIGDATPDNGVFLFRPAVYATAVFIDFGGETPETREMSALGMGVSWGKYTTKADGSAYCNIGLQGSLWTGINFGEDNDTKLGVSVVGEFLNRFFSVGPAMYFDAGKPKFGVMANVSYRF